MTDSATSAANRNRAFTVAERILDDPRTAFADKGVGFVGPDVPIEVLLASGSAFGHLPWIAGAATPWANRWLESSFPFWARSIVEQWHAGVFDHLSAVVFSRADDASQRLYYYIREFQRRGLFRGPAPLIFDIAHVRRESSIEHTAAEIRRLCDALGVDPEALLEAIEQANALRRRLAGIDAARRSDGPAWERVGRAALWSNPLHWIDELTVPQRSFDALRIVLAGSVPPDDRIHIAVEAAAASVIGETHMHSLRRLGAPLLLDAQPPELALAQHLQAESLSPRAGIDRAHSLVGRARETQAAAVVMWLTREDEALAWSVPAHKRALAEAGIPVLVLPAAKWRFDDASRERLEAFIRAVHNDKGVGLE